MTSECRLTCLVLTSAEGAMRGRPNPVGEALAAVLTAESGADNEYARDFASSGGRERACARIWRMLCRCSGIVNLPQRIFCELGFSFLCILTRRVRQDAPTHVAVRGVCVSRQTFLDHSESLTTPPRLSARPQAARRKVKNVNLPRFARTPLPSRVYRPARLLRSTTRAASDAAEAAEATTAAAAAAAPSADERVSIAKPEKPPSRPDFGTACTEVYFLESFIWGRGSRSASGYGGLIP